MHLDEQHHFVPYTDEDKQAVRKEIGLKESVLEDDIDAILDWYKKQPHLAETPIERDIIEKILVGAKGSREKTKSRVDNFLKHRALAPELIQSRIELLTKSNEKMWTFFHQAVIPKLYQGNRISIISFEGDPSSFDTEILYRNSFIVADLRLKYDYMFREIWVVDLNNTGFGHLLRYNPVVLQKAINIYQDGTGIRVSKIHCVNAPVFGQQVVNFMKKFIKTKVIERVVVHDTLESLHKHLPKECLPKDYGGDQPSIKEFSDNFEKEFRSGKTKETLIDMCKLVSNENKRPREKYDEEYMEGSFKKLDFD